MQGQDVHGKSTTKPSEEPPEKAKGGANGDGVNGAGANGGASGGTNDAVQGAVEEEPSPKAEDLLDKIDDIVERIKDLATDENAGIFSPFDLES
jgi:hypothetical protein